MIRLTVLYNLPEGTDEAEFLRWRLGEHQQSNASMEGVIRTNFARVDERWTPDNWQAAPPHRFMTISEWEDRASFEKSFYDPKTQAKLLEDIKKIADPVFLISEILITT